MRWILSAIALVACSAQRPSPHVEPYVAPASRSAAPPPKPMASAATEGEVTVTLMSAQGVVEFDDAGIGKSLGACATHVGSARGWLLLRIELDKNGATAGVQIVDRKGLPEDISSCVSLRLRGRYVNAAVVYLSVH